MSRFRTRKLEDLRGHGKLLCGRFGPLEEGFHGLRGYLVTDGRVRPFAVVLGLDELDHRVLGGVAGLEAPAMAHLVLQRREERLGHGVVVAVAGAAARQAHVVGARPLGQRPAGVLRAPVAVEYGVPRNVAARLGRLDFILALTAANTNLCGHRHWRSKSHMSSNATAQIAESSIRQKERT